MTTNLSSTRISDGSSNSISAADLIGINLDGIHVIQKRLADGTTRIYTRHRKTNEKLPGKPGSAEWTKRRRELDAQVGKKKREASTLAGLMDAWMSSTEYDDNVTSQSHRDNNERVCALIKAARVVEAETKVLSPPLGETPIKMLCDKSFRISIKTYRQQLADQRKAAGKSLREVDAHMTALCACLAWGVEQEKLPFHPIGKYKKLYKSQRVAAIFGEDHIEAWLTEARKGGVTYKCREIELVFLLALTLGQRAGDLRQLRWSDYVVNRETGLRGFNIWPLKTRKSQSCSGGFVPVLPFVGDILDAMRGMPTEPVLTLNDKAWMPRTLSYYFGNVTRDAGCVARIEGKDAKGNRTWTDMPLHQHDLRGTLITWLGIAGCSEREIASISGHTLTDNATSEIIGKYLKRDPRIAAQAIAKLSLLPEIAHLQAMFSHWLSAPVKQLPASVLQLTYQPELQAAE